MAADEFDLIARLFAPLANDRAARGLTDDVAVLTGYDRLIVTTDAIVEGVHFLPNDPIETIAQKAVRVNVSDLIAKGGRPVGIVVALIWPDARRSEEIARFAEGLGRDLARYDLALLGGDLTATKGPLTIAVTAFGAPLGPRTPHRADARSGEDVWLSGPVGDAWLGLEALSDRSPFEPGQRALEQGAIALYRVPEPPYACAGLIAAHARASIDLSDGLAGDALKLARASQVALEIDAAAIPLSPAARAFSGGDLRRLARLFEGGDDYQVLFTAGPTARPVLEGAGCARIGRVATGQGVRILAPDGAALPALDGFRHQLGAA